jgi:uncharacterized protein
MTPLAARDPRVDALRGFALLGIVVVNVQSFLWGATNPVGYLAELSSLADRVVYFLTAAFVSMKFMPLFAMLFGASFALLYCKLAALTATPRPIYRRRMLFLFVFGLLHGVFFYLGDITHMYAVAGLVLLVYVDRDAAGIGRAARHWWVGTALFHAVLFFLVSTVAPAPDQLATDAALNFEIFSEADYAGELPQRLREFRHMLFANLVGLPMTVALMLTGMTAARSGWLADRNAAAWRTASRIGLVVGLPASLLYGWWLLREAETLGLGASPLAATVPMWLSVALAFFYAAAFMRRAPERVVRWLAPAGRMPLTNYFLQSVAMGALLSGWGLALGPQLNYWQTAVLGLGIFIVQMGLSHVWLAHMRQGPLEALWRAWTYRGISAPASGS